MQVRIFVPRHCKGAVWALRRVQACVSMLVNLLADSWFRVLSLPAHLSILAQQLCSCAMLQVSISPRGQQRRHTTMRCSRQPALLPAQGPPKSSPRSNRWACCTFADCPACAAFLTLTPVCCAVLEDSAGWLQCSTLTCCCWSAGRRHPRRRAEGPGKGREAESGRELAAAAREAFEGGSRAWAGAFTAEPGVCVHQVAMRR